jgi:primosomal protein N' (replication factor Y)
METLFGTDIELDKQSADNMPRCVAVLVPYPIDKAYDYAVPDGVDVQIGDIVCVPLGPREIAGVVWGEPEGKTPPKKIKSIVSKYDVRPLADEMRAFVDRTASYTMTPKGSVLKMALSVPAALEPAVPVKAYQGIDLPEGTSLSPQRKAVIDVLADGYARRPSEIADLAGCSSAVVTGMAKKGLLKTVELTNPAPCQNPDPSRAGADLSQDQRAAADVLCEHVKSGAYHASLLDGVTGAGKTEVYFEAIAEALKAGKQAVLMLPEIALSNAFLDRFQSRFGCAPALWHSGLTPAQRRNTWRGVVNGHTRVVVGARSSLYLPYPDLGLIIVDEEHDPAYKQEDGVIYHARDMAVMRAHLSKIPICLVSATPALETMQNVWDGRYEHLELTARYGGAQMPDIHMIDMRAKPEEGGCERGEFIAPKLKQAVQETIERGEQALLFLNRRGYAPLTLCRSCGHRFECPRCTAWLTEHKRANKLECHHCGFYTRPPKDCPACGEAESLVPCGPGVERIAEEAQKAFPDARMIILASDTIQDNEELRKTLIAIREGEYNIIIGTQIMAKGHHLPNLTCVGVIDADLGLDGGELRAAERTYQLLHQVSGRAGRADKPGHVYLQSFMPDHRIMKALCAGARDPFLEMEADEREESHMPPFSRLAGIIIAGRDLSLVESVAKELGKTSPQGMSEAGSVQTLGPAPAVYARLRGKHRMRLLVRADKSVAMQPLLSRWVNGVKVPSGVRVYVDIDPQSFF